MEAIKNGIDLPKRKRWRPSKKVNDAIVSVFEAQDGTQNVVQSAPIPDWKSFSVKNIANINSLWNQILTLKDVKVDENWDKYIVVKWRRYYEFSEKSPKSSMYILNENSLFLWDKFEWLTYWSWVSFRYTNRRWEQLDFYQGKTIYSWWVMHLKQTYKSESYVTSNVIATIIRNWKKVNITENLIKKYLNWEWSNTLNDAVETAIKTNPEVFAYVESLKEQII